MTWKGMEEAFIGLGEHSSGEVEVYDSTLLMGVCGSWERLGNEFYRSGRSGVAKGVKVEANRDRFWHNAGKRWLVFEGLTTAIDGLCYIGWWDLPVCLYNKNKVLDIIRQTTEISLVDESKLEYLVSKRYEDLLLPITNSPVFYTPQ